MRKSLLLIAFIYSVAATGSNINAQLTPPPGAGDKDLRDTGVKSRSVEMERIKREANKFDKPTTKNSVTPNSATEDKLAAKYGEIKTDYEQIQLLQDVIIKTYQGTGKIDYAQIGKLALEINEGATRLNSNLFPMPPTGNIGAIKETKIDKTADKENKSAKSIRDLIVDLDKSIGSFATSPMFQNLRIIDAEISEKARLDIEQIIELSKLLAAEAGTIIKTN